MGDHHSSFEYLYRDAGNYKVRRTILLRGQCTEDDRTLVRSALESGEFFIPEQVGLESLQNELSSYGDVPNTDDHVWHEFIDLRPASSAETSSARPHTTVSALVSDFEAVKQWDEALSPLYQGLLIASTSR